MRITKLTIIVLLFVINCEYYNSFTNANIMRNIDNIKTTDSLNKEIILSNLTNLDNFSEVSGQLKVKIAKIDSSIFIDKEANSTLKIYSETEFNFSFVIGTKNKIVFEVYGMIIRGGLTYFIETAEYQNGNYYVNITLISGENFLPLSKTLIFQNSLPSTSPSSQTTAINNSTISSSSHSTELYGLASGWEVIPILISFIPLTIFRIKRK